MGKLRHVASVGIGQPKEKVSGRFNLNHFISSVPLPAPIAKKVASMGLSRVAGNVYECPSTHDFWKVQGNKIVKLVGSDEVDNGESIVAAPRRNPQGFMSSVMGDIEF
jgi:hypothetical protein